MSENEIKKAHLDAFRKAADHYNRAIVFLHEGRRGRAKKEFVRALEELPQHAYAAYYLSSIAYVEGDRERALTLIDNAVSSTDFLRDLVKKAGELKYKSLFKDTENLKIEDSYENSCTLSARIRREIDFNEERIDDINERLNRLDQKYREAKANFVFFRANILAVSGKLKLAYRDYLETLKLNPRQGECYNNLANLFFQGKDYETALKWIKEAEFHQVGESIDLLLRKNIFSALQLSTEGIMESIYPGGTALFIIPINTDTVTGRRLYENCYMVWDDETKEAILIDPGAPDERIDAFIEERELKLCGILNTHGHPDHIGGNRYYADKYKVSVTAHEKERDSSSTGRIKNQPDNFLEDEKPFKKGTFQVQPLIIPGHSEGSTCYLIDGDLFSGDTLVRNGVGRCSGENPEIRDRRLKKMISLIKEKLLVLPEETRVFPGHGDPTSIGREKKNNPFLY